MSCATNDKSIISSQGAIQGALGFFGLGSFYNPYGNDPTENNKLEQLKADTQIASAKLSIITLQKTANLDKDILKSINSTIGFLNNQSDYLFETGKFAKQEISFISSLGMVLVVLVTIFFVLTK
jgi:hypothetical protein